MMTEEQQFWNTLMFLVSGELMQLEASRALGLWCDGFEPLEYGLDHVLPRISGRVWLGLGPKTQERWSFEFILRRRHRDRSSLPWSALLPTTEGNQRWLSVDVGTKHLRISPPSRLLGTLGHFTDERGPVLCGVEDDLEDCVRLARQSSKCVEVLGAATPEDRFIRVLLDLSRRWGPPHHPSEEGWRSELDLATGMLAVWDLDDHAISLRLLGEATLLTCHEADKAMV